MPDTHSNYKLPVALVIASSLALAACSSMPGSSSSSSTTSSSSSSSSSSAKAAPNSYQPVSDVPIPGGTKINTDKSVILGQGDKWFGRMVLVTDRPSTQAYTYYQEQMPTFGWEPVTAVQGKTSIMTFTRGDRAATLEINSGTLSGSEVAITVSPRQAGAAAPAPTAEKK